jgi:hypothetical protein
MALSMTGTPRMRAIGAILGMTLLGGCAYFSEPTAQPAVPAIQQSYASSIPTEKLVGKWGIASFRDEADRPRTEKEARSQCRQPYVIAKGPTDGVLMHVADDAKLYELKLKGGPDGRTYLGFEAPPGHKQDREILSYSDDVIVMSFVTPSIAERYGTFVYVRCPS